MVLGGVESVNSDGVGLQLLEVGDVAFAGGCVRERVGEVSVCAVSAGAVGRDILLIGNTLDEELGAIGLVEELGALEGGQFASMGRSRCTDLDDDGVECCLGECRRREERRSAECARDAASHIDVAQVA